MTTTWGSTWTLGGQPGARLSPLLLPWPMQAAVESASALLPLRRAGRPYVRWKPAERRPSFLKVRS